MSTDWDSDLKKAKARGKENIIARDYVLPGKMHKLLNTFYVCRPNFLESRLTCRQHAKTRSTNVHGMRDQSRLLP